MIDSQTLKTVMKYVGTAVSGAFVGASLQLIDIHEGGMVTKPFKDSGGVWTVCWGHTASVDPNKTYTKEECDELLAKDFMAHLGAIKGLDELPETVKLGVFDFGYNKGVGAANKSTFKKTLLEIDNDGIVELYSQQYKEAEEQVMWWKYITINKGGKSYKYDCSTPNNKVCMGVWKRLQWQSAAIGNQFESLDEAVEAARELY